MNRFLKEYPPNETNNLLSERDFKQNGLLFTITALLKLDVVPNSPENIIFQHKYDKAIRFRGRV